MIADIKCELRLPSHFVEYWEMLMSNLDSSINFRIAETIRNKSLFARYVAWNFNGLVWWNVNENAWCAEVWVTHSYICSYSAAELTALANEITSTWRREIAKF